MRTVPLPERFDWQHLQQGPEEWKVMITKWQRNGRSGVSGHCMLLWLLPGGGTNPVDVEGKTHLEVGSLPEHHQSAVAPDERAIYLITGIMASGKSTVAERLAS